MANRNALIVTQNRPYMDFTQSLSSLCFACNFKERNNEYNINLKMQL